MYRYGYSAILVASMDMSMKYKNFAITNVRIRKDLSDKCNFYNVLPLILSKHYKIYQTSKNIYQDSRFKE